MTRKQQAHYKNEAACAKLCGPYPVIVARPRTQKIMWTIFFILEICFSYLEILHVGFLTMFAGDACLTNEFNGFFFSTDTAQNAKPIVFI